MKMPSWSLALLVAGAAASNNPWVLAPSKCTKTQLVNPGGNGAPNCVFAGRTRTIVVGTDCGGCALTTQTLRVPIPCTSVSTNRHSTKTVTSLTCKPSPTCTQHVAPPPFSSGPTCTSYDHTITATSTIDCTGCAVQTMFFGHGPVRLCRTVVTSPTSTFVKKVCTPA